MISNVTALRDPSNMSLLGGISGQGPETGELDLFQYLLGLQDSLNVSSDPLLPLTELNAEGVATQKEKEEPSDLLAGQMAAMAFPMPTTEAQQKPPAPEEPEGEAAPKPFSDLSTQITTPHKGESLAAQDLQPIESKAIEPIEAFELPATGAPETALEADGPDAKKEKKQIARNESYEQMARMSRTPDRSVISEGTSSGSELQTLNPFRSNEPALDEASERKPDPSTSEAKAEPVPFSVTSGPTEKIAENEAILTTVRNARASEGVTPNQLFQRVESLIHQGGGRMTVVLDPPELGRVEVQVQARGNRVEIGLRSELEQTRHLLENQLGDLKQSLHSQDLILSKIEFQVGKELGHATQNMSLGSGMWNGSPSSQHSHSFNFSQGAQRSYRNNHSQPSAPVSLNAVSAAPARQASNGRVDIRI